MRNSLICILALTILNACSITRATPAPVINVTAPQAATPVTPPVSSSNTPAIAAPANSGTTINKMDNEDEAPVINNIPAKKTPPSKEKPASAVEAAASANLGGIDWLAPTNGSIVQTYTLAAKGVDVTGKEGQAIVAAASGKVAYSGNGLKGYGNLIIIKHQDNYLTAYSHNKLNLVKEGDMVKRGQKIAELGKTESDKPLLHFELRKNGKPINPSSIFNK